MTSWCSVPKIREAIRELGYEALDLPDASTPSLRQISIHVGGMSCAACVRRVENALKDIPGVANAVVHLATSRATIKYWPQSLPFETLKSVVEETGYQFLGVVGEHLADPIEEARALEQRRLLQRLIAGGILTTLVMALSMPHWVPFLAHLTDPASASTAPAWAT